jgi:hypothetical protein
VLPALPAGVLASITTIDPDVASQRTEQYGVQIERAIAGALSAQVGYSRIRGHHLIMSHNINVPTLTAAQAAALGVPNLGRPDPRFGNVSQYDGIGDSWFHGLTVSLNTRPAAWGSARVSYTLSRAQDDSGNAFFSSPQDNARILDDKRPSDNDQRHRLVVSGTFGAAPSGTMSRALGGFQVGYVWAYASGVPFNVQTGADRNGDTTVNDRPAGVGRNSARQPATSSLDLRVSRAFALPHGQRLEAIVDAFNLLNHENVLAVNNIIGSGPTPNAAFGRPTVAGDARQIQLGVRWSF